MAVQFNEIRPPADLLLAAAEGREDDVWLLLTRSDIGTNLQDENSQTALSHAARRGQEKVVKMLLAQSDIEVDISDRYQKTPLRYAAENGHKAVI